MALFSRAHAPADASSGSLQAALQAACKVSEIASSAMPLPDAIGATLAVASDLFEAEQASVMLLEDDGTMLVLSASVGLPTDVPQGHRLRVGESVAGRVIATGAPLLLGDVDRDAFENFVPKNRPISSSMVVPLRVTGRPIGVLNLATARPSTVYTDQHLRLAQMFADQAAGLIHRARLHERAEQRSSDLMALVESSRGLLGSLETDELLQKVLDGGIRLAGSKDGFACLFDPETGTITRGVFRGVDKSTISALVARPEVVAARESGDTVTFVHDELGMMISIGLNAAHTTKGVLVLSGDAAFLQGREDLMKAFAQQCSAALSSAQLHSVILRKETELSSIIQGVPNPIVLVDASDRIVALNPAAEELFGLSVTFSSGVPVKGSLGTEIEELLLGDGEVQTEISAGNPPRTYKARVTDLRMPGVPFGRVLMMDDVTAEREMVQIQRDFVAMIGHELRTPLTIVKGFARTLLRRLDKANKQEARDALETIDARAAQLERLIEDLLYVSKIEAREASLRIEEVDVAILAKAVAEDVVGQYEDREVLLDVPESLQWPCDETKVGLVLRHLIENGFKYSQAPAPVTVRLYRDEDELRVDVADKGTGIVSSDIPNIFKRFSQLDGTSTREKGGTGTGLYLCSQLIRVHEGRIWCDSAWGKGSTFSLALPRRSTGNEAVSIHGRRDETA